MHLSHAGYSVLLTILVTFLYLNFIHFGWERESSIGSQVMKIQLVHNNLEGGALQLQFFKTDSKPLMFSDAMRLLANGNEDFGDILNTIIASFPAKAVFWECISITPATFDSTPFEFVLLPSIELERTVTDMLPFQPQFEAYRNSIAGSMSGTEVISFKNLGGDATLVVPCPPDLINMSKSPSEFGHLAIFFRESTPAHRFELWRTVGATVIRTVQKAMSEGSIGQNERFWLSTSGLGVAWLHVRIDSKPKYYNWLPYKNVGAEP